MTSLYCVLIILLVFATRAFMIIHDEIQVLMNCRKNNTTYQIVLVKQKCLAEAAPSSCLEVHNKNKNGSNAILHISYICPFSDASNLTFDHCGTQRASGHFSSTELVENQVWGH